MTKELIHSILCLIGIILILYSCFSLKYIHLFAGTILLVIYGNLISIKINK